MEYATGELGGRESDSRPAIRISVASCRLGYEGPRVQQYGCTLRRAPRLAWKLVLA